MNTNLNNLPFSGILYVFSFVLAHDPVANSRFSVIASDSEAISGEQIAASPSAPRDDHRIMSKYSLSYPASPRLRDVSSLKIS